MNWFCCRCSTSDKSGFVWACDAHKSLPGFTVVQTAETDDISADMTSELAELRQKNAEMQMLLYGICLLPPATGRWAECID
jgi:hypothetical protein